MHAEASHSQIACGIMAYFDLFPGLICNRGDTHVLRTWLPRDIRVLAFAVLYLPSITLTGPEVINNMLSTDGALKVL